MGRRYGLAGPWVLCGVDLVRIEGANGRRCTVTLARTLTSVRG
ncbi:hypothetical protein ACFV6Z_12840 [Streptomyces sp. NPDC059818]